MRNKVGFVFLSSVYDNDEHFLVSTARYLFWFVEYRFTFEQSDDFLGSIFHFHALPPAFRPLETFDGAARANALHDDLFFPMMVEIPFLDSIVQSILDFPFLTCFVFLNLILLLLQL